VAHLPGEEGIVEDCINVFAIAHTYYVSAISQKNFVPFQYLRKNIEENADRILIEKLLGLAAKVRFLDDRTEVVKKHDRKLRTIGIHYIDGKETDDVGIRTALNKLIHHQRISIETEEKSILVVGGGKDTGDLKIPEGGYKEKHVIIKIKGEYRSQAWRFELDLFILLNEIQRLFFIQQSNPRLELDAP
jgi:hypothetical protein